MTGEETAIIALRILGTALAFSLGVIYFTHQFLRQNQPLHKNKFIGIIAVAVVCW
jgi:hypothetical protein